MLGCAPFQELKNYFLRFFNSYVNLRSILNNYHVFIFNAFAQTFFEPTITLNIKKSLWAPVPN
jgi:hypothetical protein